MTDIPWLGWYQSLAKPSWTPAPGTIGLIWQVLYPVIIATFGFVFMQAGRGNYLPAPTSPVSVNAVPEPSTCLPVLVGLASGLSAVSRNRHYGRLRRSRIIA
jgi:hypothetical protein